MIPGFPERWFGGGTRVGAGAGAVVLRDNWGVVNTGVIDGDMVVCNGAEYPLSLAIPRVDDPGPTVSGLLGWRSRIPAALIGRDAELAELLRWAQGDARVRVRILHGPGGAGKSRLAVELAERLRGEGWEAGLLPDPGHSVAYRRSAQGTLLILDEAGEFPDAVQRLLGRLNSGEPPDARLRILLLCRGLEQMAPRVNGVVPGLHSPPLELRPLPQAAQAWALFLAGWADMARRLGKAGARPPLDEAGLTAWLAQDELHALPLLVLAHALNLLHDPTALGPSRHEIVTALVDRERARIEAECRANDELNDPQVVRGALLLKALAALPGRLDAASIHALRAGLRPPGAGPSQAGGSPPGGQRSVGAHPTGAGPSQAGRSPPGGQRSVGAHPTGIALPVALALRSTSLWQRGDGGGHLPELQPDLLAANLLYRTLAELLPDDATRGEWLWQTLAQGASTTAQWQRRFTRLARLSVDRPLGGQQSVGAYPPGAGRAPADPLIAALSGMLRCHPERARACRPALEGDTLERPLHPLAVAAMQGVLGAGGLEPAEEARLLNILSIRLAESGAQRGALAAIRRAVEIYEGLAAQDLAAWGPDLAISLNNLSVHLGGSGEFPGAGPPQAGDSPLGGQRSVGANTPGAGPPQAGDSPLGGQRSVGAHPPGALVAMRRAVEIYERLAAENFAAWGPDLAMSLNNLSIRLADSGQRAGGLVAIRRAVEIGDKLAADNFAAWAPDLARSLNVLALYLAAGGERPGALAAIRRAVEIQGKLVADNVAQAPDLARSRDILRELLPQGGDPP